MQVVEPLLMIDSRAAQPAFDGVFYDAATAFIR